MKNFIQWRHTLCGFKCPYCKIGILSPKIIYDYECAEGFVEQATVNVCSKCDGHVVTEAAWDEMRSEIELVKDLS